MTRPARQSPDAQDRRDSVSAALFLAPALLLVGAFVVWPLIHSGTLSFYRWNGASAPDFIGLDNYTRLVTDGYFWAALLRNVVIAVTAIGLQVFLALAIAYALVRMYARIGRVFLFLYLVPVIISEICIGLLWRFIYNPYFGLVNGLLRGLGLDSLQRGWLGESGTAFGAIIVVMSFTYLGLYVLLFVGALRNVPESIYEAAEIDGATHYHAFFAITVPMVWDTVRANILLCIVGSLKTFSLVFVLTNGGPNRASEVISTYLYSVGFGSFEMGYAATIGFVQMLLTGVGAFIVFRTMSRRSDVTT
jgi:raffinose/stachyose/melibiose transport system permease protein